MTKDLAPIVLFVYNRLWHTQQTVEALKNNKLSKNSKLFVFSDGWKNPEDKQNVEEVRNFIKSINGFKDIEIVIQEKNIFIGIIYDQ